MHPRSTSNLIVILTALLLMMDILPSRGAQSDLGDKSCFARESRSYDAGFEAGTNHISNRLFVESALLSGSGNFRYLSGGLLRSSSFSFPSSGGYLLGDEVKFQRFSFLGTIFYSPSTASCSTTSGKYYTSSATLNQSSFRPDLLLSYEVIKRKAFSFSFFAGIDGFVDSVSYKPSLSYVNQQAIDAAFPRVVLPQNLSYLQPQADAKRKAAMDKAIANEKATTLSQKNVTFGWVSPILGASSEFRIHDRLVLNSSCSYSGFGGLCGLESSFGVKSGLSYAFGKNKDYLPQIGYQLNTFEFVRGQNSISQISFGPFVELGKKF
jgi:hypothetical protein